ncbi:hypothetical protein CLOP_g10339 [Closterium sp. NIES-67]|nr:hypothetical protein CLOP_g10339 [Closterium sp. NIES-67]
MAARSPPRTPWDAGNAPLPPAEEPLESLPPLESPSGPHGGGLAVAVRESPRWTAAGVGNLALLAVCFALGWAALFVQVASTTVAAKQWGGTALSTVPYGVLAAAHALWALPAQLIIRATHSARPSFIAGGALGVIGNALFALAAGLAHDAPSPSSSAASPPPTQPVPMALLCAGGLCAGLANAYINFLRFEAARFAPSAAHLPTAISAVVAGGVVGGGMGPIISRVTRGVIPGHEFLATYLVSCALFAVETVLVALVPLHATQRCPPEGGPGKIGGGSGGGGGGESGDGSGSTVPDKAGTGLQDGPCRDDHMRHEAAGGAQQEGERAVMVGDGDGEQSKEGHGGVAGCCSCSCSRGGGPTSGGERVALARACSRGDHGEEEESGEDCREEAGMGDARRASSAGKSSCGEEEEGEVMEGGRGEGGEGGEEGDAVVVLVGSGSRAGGAGEHERRRWFDVMGQADVVVAVAAATVAYASMATVMLTAVIAMLAVQPGTGSVDLQGQLGGVISFGDTSNVILVHVEAMFVPSFFTPVIIAALGSDGAMLLGFVLLLASQLALLAGTSLPLFFLCLALLGLGWNLAFVGATALLATAYRPHEKDMVQGINDGIVFGVNTVVAATASAVLQRINSWPTFLLIYSLASSPALLLTLAFWLGRRHLLPFHWPGVSPSAPAQLAASASALPSEPCARGRARGAWGGKGKQLVRSLSQRLGVSGRVAGMKWG